VIPQSLVVYQYSVLYAGKLLKERFELTVAQLILIVHLEDVVELLISHIAVIVLIDLLYHLHYVLQFVVFEYNID
jgi:hypothetical protein